MGKYDGYLFCTDIDGTLTCDGKISEKNLAAIEKFTLGGGMFSLASGRFADFAEKMLGFSPDFPVIAINGALISDRREMKTVWKRPLSKTEALAAAEAVKAVFAENAEGLLSARVCYESDDFTCEKAEGTEKAIFCGKEAFKVVIKALSPEACVAARDFILSRFPGKLNVSRSCSHLVELMSPDAGKNVGMKKLAEIFGAKVTVAAGDYENDTDMVRDADMGFAVGNAIPEVKAAARFHAPSNREDAIAYIIDSLPPL